MRLGSGYHGTSLEDEPGPNWGQNCERFAYMDVGNQSVSRVLSRFRTNPPRGTWCRI